jgi:hypothetical protein
MNSFVPLSHLEFHINLCSLAGRTVPNTSRPKNNMYTCNIYNLLFLFFILFWCVLKRMYVTFSWFKTQNTVSAHISSTDKEEASAGSNFFLFFNNSDPQSIS